MRVNERHRKTEEEANEDKERTRGRSIAILDSEMNVTTKEMKARREDGQGERQCTLKPKQTMHF